MRVGVRVWSRTASGSVRPGDQAEFGGQVLHQPGHHVGQHDHPDQQEAELRAGADVGGDVARVDVGDGCDEGGSEQVPAGLRDPGLLCQPMSSLTGVWT